MFFVFNNTFSLSFLSVCFREDFDQEEKARFGELCSGENGKAREWFAKYVSVQVWWGGSSSTRVSEFMLSIYTWYIKALV